MSILSKYVDDVLTPEDDQIKFLKQKIRRIRNILTRNSSLPPREIHAGGSLEKGTMLRHHLDGDVICVYNHEQEIGKNWQKLMLAVHKDLQANFPHIDVEPAGNLAIHINTSFKNKDVNFDVVPCYYVNSPAMMKDHVSSKLYTAITTIWHSRFMLRYKDLPHFTDSVRLLKDWMHEHDIPLKGIHLELITADVYDNYVENPNAIDDIDKVLHLAFEDITATLDGYPVVPSHWKYCKRDDYKKQYESPVIIDPANPNDNLLLGQKDIKKMKWKVLKTIENLEQRNYNAIFNRKNLINYF
jgi:hypothetical protein